MILNVNTEKTKENLEICALYTNPKKNRAAIDVGDDFNRNLDLLDVTPYDGCIAEANNSFSNKTILTRIYSIPNCTVQTILANLELNHAKLAIIGTNGPIVSTQKSNLKERRLFTNSLFFKST